MTGIIRTISAISLRECRMLRSRPVFFFIMIIAPIVCLTFFVTLMSSGLPADMPAGMVDEDNTRTTRILCRILDSMQMTDLRHKYTSFDEAHAAMRRGEIYAFFYIPEGTTSDAVSNRRPKISFYTNDTYLVPANLMMKDMLTVSELASLGLYREKLRAAGLSEDEIMAWLQPVVVQSHPTGNPTLNYSVYLSNMIVPGIFILLVMLSSTYTIGIEWKNNTQKAWYSMSGNSQTIALIGKLLPQTLIFTCQFVLMDLCFFYYCGYPCNCGIGIMMLLGLLTVLASQGFSVLLFGIQAGMMRLALCICSLWGILSFSLAGFTYPVTDMHPILRGLSVLFPLRHYYLIYVNQALDGFPIYHVWPSVCWLIAFCFMPLLVNYRYRKAFLVFEYLP